MEFHLSAAHRFDLQQNYRRYLKYQEQYSRANAAFNASRASRVWMVAAVLLVFAASSVFFLGASAGLFGLYFYRIMLAWYERSKAQEGREQMQRWFLSKGLRFQGRTLYARDDEQLEKPLDPFDDSLYSD